MEKASIEISQPRRFGLGAILGIYAFGFLLIIPILIAVLIVSLMRLGLFTLAIPLLVTMGTIYIIPFVGNAYISRVVRGHALPPAQDGSRFIVQITFSPRICAGLRALLEDADDVGHLTITQTEIIFRGDSVNLTIPFSQIRNIQAENVGLRGLYIAAGRIRLEVGGMDEFQTVEIAERSSRVLPTSRRISRELLEAICKGKDEL
jgi:hypothetical protein